MTDAIPQLAALRHLGWRHGVSKVKNLRVSKRELFVLFFNRLHSVPRLLFRCSRLGATSASRSLSIHVRIRLEQFSSRVPRNSHSLRNRIISTPTSDISSRSRASL